MLLIERTTRLVSKATRSREKRLKPNYLLHQPLAKVYCACEPTLSRTFSFLWVFWAGWWQFCLLVTHLLQNNVYSMQLMHYLLALWLETFRDLTERAIERFLYFTLLVTGSGLSLSILLTPLLVLQVCISVSCLLASVQAMLCGCNTCGSKCIVHLESVRVCYHYHLFKKWGMSKEATLVNRNNQPFILCTLEDRSRSQYIEVNENICQETVDITIAKLKISPTLKVIDDVLNKPPGWQTYFFREKAPSSRRVFCQQWLHEDGHFVDKKFWVRIPVTLSVSIWTFEVASTM